MDRFQRFNDVARVALASTCSAIAVLVLDYAAGLFDSRLIGGVAAVLFVSLIAMVANYALEQLIDRSTGLRQWIAGDDFIEGWWLDVARTAHHEAPAHATILHIKYQARAYSVSGTGYSRSGDQLSTWNAAACDYRRRTLYLVYESVSETMKGGLEHGVVQLQFGMPTNSYSGHVQDFSGQVVLSVRGQRVDEKDLKTYRQLAHSADRVSYLQARVPGWQ